MLCFLGRSGILRLRTHSTTARLTVYTFPDYCTNTAIGCSAKKHKNIFKSEDFIVLKTFSFSSKCQTIPNIKQLSKQQTLQNEIQLQKTSDVEFKKVKNKVVKLPAVYASLSKWYLTLFVVMTMDAGYCLAMVPFNYSTFFLTTIGTLLCSASANTLNQVAEVPYDAQMDRTRHRPLVCHLITPLHAVCFASVAALTGFSLLYYGGNALTACLGLSTIILYTAVYTPLKRRHWFNTWVGSVVGAIPPLMGWTAATGALDAGAFILSGILYAWQFPHFYSLAWRRRGDYARGAYHMLPLSHPDATKHVVVAHSLALWGLCSAAPATGVTTIAFAGLALPLNVWLTYHAMRFHRKGDSRSAQGLYKCTLYYIMLISMAMIVDRKFLSRFKSLNECMDIPLHTRLWAL